MALWTQSTGAKSWRSSPQTSLPILQASGISLGMCLWWVLSFLSRAKKTLYLRSATKEPKRLSQTVRRWGYSLRSAWQTLQLWQGTMKEIGSKFGTSVLIYFVFLKWLLMFNVVSFLINFGFITIPLLVYDHSPNVPANVTFRGLEILTGAVSESSFWLPSMLANWSGKVKVSSVPLVVEWSKISITPGQPCPGFFFYFFLFLSGFDFLSPGTQGISDVIPSGNQSLHLQVKLADHSQSKWKIIKELPSPLPAPSHMLMIKF